MRVNISFLSSLRLGTFPVTCILNLPGDTTSMIAGLNVAMACFHRLFPHTTLAVHECVGRDRLPFVVLATHSLTSYELDWLQLQLVGLVLEGSCSLRVPRAANLAKPVAPGHLRICRFHEAPTQPFLDLGAHPDPDAEAIDFARAIVRFSHEGLPCETVHEGSQFQYRYMASRPLTSAELERLNSGSAAVQRSIHPIEGVDWLFEIPDAASAP